MTYTLDDALKSISIPNQDKLHLQADPDCPNCNGHGFYWQLVFMHPYAFNTTLPVKCECLKFNQRNE